jgi:LysR family transcriptional regulator, carnitine catabolism transcriptional activator
MKFELKHLEAFVAAARYGSFTRAAAALGISQPTFTVHIRQLEDALGVRLLDRTTRPIDLTPIGRELAGPLERALRDIDSAFLNIEELSQKMRGVVAVAALPSLAASVLAGVIARFKIAHPGIAVRPKDAVGRRIATMVKSGEVDFGFGSIPAGEPDLDFTTLFADRMGAIFRRGCPLERKKAVSLAELVTYPLILMDRDSSVRSVLDPALARIEKFSAPEYEATYISTALAMVRAGLGVAIVPEAVLQMEDRRRLGWIPIDKPILDRSIGIVRRRGRSLSPAAQALLEAIEEACAKPKGNAGRSLSKLK